MVLTGVGLGFFVGAFPTLAMMIASCLLTTYEVGPKIEACFQNFAAGLIIAAVAGELFPIMASSSEQNSVLGITIGFVGGLLVVFGLEKVVDYLENLPPSMFQRLSTEESVHGISLSAFDRVGSDDSSPRKRTFTYPEGAGPADFLEEGEGDLAHNEDGDEWEDEPVNRASQAIAAPEHRGHIREHLQELLTVVKSMEDKSNELLERGDELTVPQEEAIAEKIDEEVHSLMYKLDHVRRLLQGSESEHFTSPPATNQKRRQTSNWVTEERKLGMKKKLSKIKLTAEHLLEHIDETQIDRGVLEEMYAHMATLDRQLTKFHDIVERNASKWQRNCSLPQTQIGDRLPVNLILPVTIDCFVDGFLIGVSVAISPKAGFILAVANCFEMSFLGMAYASRLVKCTGASQLSRNVALYAPPLIMFLASGLGALMAHTVAHIPMIFIAFVAFGVVALLFLVCNELLIEAKNAQGEEEKWWISIYIFLGIYMVLIISQLVPEDQV
uniref:Uncharacterized protein n=2 Tax=Spumella elongata TaxID=89044 RepID=A0A7S3M8C8_9STRA|mmetsp:Transcript_39432/g.68336  ORF Transcript_39432/g.68336 Transcript_39432/m.68336 type:complete len:498 (+) Transcript_39432:122-1615(+)